LLHADVRRIYRFVVTTWTRKVSRCEAFAIVGLVILANVLVAAYLVRWDLGFNSDTAISGIAAHRLLQYGERPIFVWGVGYQGLLLESHLIAALYALIGTHPMGAWAVSSAFFLALTSVFYILVRKIYGWQTAAWTVCLFLSSGPGIYMLFCRTMPNYTEVYLVGVITLLASWSVLRRPPEVDRRLGIKAFALGLVVGFAIYSYEQVLLFIGAALVYLGTEVAWRARQGDLSLRQFVRRLPRVWGVGSACAVPGIVLGMTPRWIYALSGGQVVDHFDWSISGTSFVERLIYGVLGFCDIFNADTAWQQGVVLTGLVMPFLGVSLYGLFVVGRGVVRRSEGKELIPWSPLLALGWVVAAAFFSYDGIVHRSSARYAAGLTLVIPVASAWLIVRGLERGGWVRLGAMVCGMLLVVSGGLRLEEHLTGPSQLTRLRAIASEMRTRELTYGYADYWLAYATTLLTTEQLILEPLESNYNPSYGPLVAARDRVSLVDRIDDGPDQPRNSPYAIGERVTTPGGEYVVEESKTVADEIVFSVVRRAR